MSDRVTTNIAVNIRAVGVANGVSRQEYARLQIPEAHSLVQQPQIAFFFLGIGFLAVGVVAPFIGSCAVRLVQCERYQRT